VLGIMIGDNRTYLDVHRDAPIHIAFVGVDYSKKASRNWPENIGECNENASDWQSDGRNKLVQPEGQGHIQGSKNSVIRFNIS